MTPSECPCGAEAEVEGLCVVHATRFNELPDQQRAGQNAVELYRASVAPTRCAWCDHVVPRLVVVEDVKVCAVCAAARAPVEEPH